MGDPQDRGDKPGHEGVLGTIQMPAGGAPPGAAPLMPTLPGAVVAAPISGPPAMPAESRYSVQAEIARGGMGRVVEAHDAVLGRTVALKEALSIDAESLRRFRRETRITARLEHPAIVPVHDAGVSATGAPYYVMRKISGRPLEDLVADASTIESRLALVPHVMTAAHAVAHAHARGIVHRDIKPSNILVGDLGETIMIDWGLAKAMGEPEDNVEPGAAIPASITTDHALQTRAGIVFGTPGFMAPEQLQGGAADERCDVYALGATLYHLLTRRPPHYDKDPDVMMRATVERAPSPLRELEPGVPPELATIVDKALAHGAAQRYPDAGALAEDLQRFLTGQLVASHHYSRRERLARFIRKNRASVGVTAVATLALLAGAWLAVGRIVNERDRADAERAVALDQKRTVEKQREQLSDSVAGLMLADARHKAEEEPTRAAALAKWLADRERWWRKGRDVAAAARLHGIAFSVPAAPHTLSLELGRDGQHLLAAGDDGLVRIVDLARRTGEVVADVKEPVRARFADGDRRIVAFRGNRLTIVEVASRAHRDVTVPSSIAKLEVQGPIAYWVDTAGAVWRFDLAADAPAKTPLDEPVHTVLPSPDGRWVALAGKSHLLLVDRIDQTLPPQVIADGETRDVAWAADGSHLAALVGDDLVDIIMAPAPAIIHRVTVGARYSVAFSGGKIYSAGPTGVGPVTRDDTRPRSAGNDFTLGVRETRDRTIVAARAQGAIAVLSEDGDQVIVSPSRLTSLEASPRSPWIVGATEGRLLIWDGDAIRPHRVTQTAPSGAAFVTGDQVIATFVDGPAQWIDLRSGRSMPIGALAGITSVIPAPDGQRAVAIDGMHHARLVAALGEPQDLPGDVTAATFVDDKRLVIAEGGAVKLADQKLLTTQKAPVRALASTPEDGGWVAAGFANGLVWRTNLTAGGDAKLAVAAAPGPGALVVERDGTVVVGGGSELRAWRADGSNDLLATLPAAIATLALADPTTVLAITTTGYAFTIDTRRAHDLETPLEIGPTYAAASNGALIVAVTATGALEIIDPVEKERWTLALPKAQTLAFPQLAPDGTRVLAITPSSLLIWTLALPATQPDTVHWLESLTDASVERDNPTAPLHWR